MYPAGIVLGANPAAVMGAIISGAAFGDNVSPVSDTTIVSAATQETDVGGGGAFPIEIRAHHLCHLDRALLCLRRRQDRIAGR